MEALINVTDPEAFQTGIFKDLAQGQVGLWKYAENVAFLDGAIEKTSGWSSSGVAANPVVQLAQAFSLNGEQRIYLATTTAFYSLINGVFTTLGSGYTASQNWALETWGDFLIASNGLQAVQVWKNTSTAVALANAPAFFKVMGKSNQHLLGYAGRTLYFSSKSDIETWTSTASNSAGELFIRNLDSDVVAAKPLGDVVLVYAANTMLVQQYTGAPDYFGFPSAPINGIGALSPDSIVTISDKHFGVCPKGFFETDGLSFRYIDRPMVNRWFLSQIDLTKANLTNGFHWEQNNTIRWTFMCKDGVRRGLDYNYISKAWCIHTVPLTAVNGQQVFQYPVIAESANIGLLGEARDRGGALLPATLLTFPFDGGTRKRYKTWHQVVIQTEAVGLFEFRIGYSDVFAAEPEWTEWLPVVEETWLNPPRDSVYLTLEFITAVAQCTWRLGTVQIYGEIGGMV